LFFSFKNNIDIPNNKTYHFAVGVIPSANSQLLSYAILTEMGGEIIGSNIIREQNFMYYIMGYWPSKANPFRENLLEKHKVDSCFLISNYSNKIIGYSAYPFKQLWKLRYNQHPFNYEAETGWSQELYKPSPQQTTFLYENYGVSNIKTDYFYGDSLFKILRDVQNPEWIDLYSKLPPE
jgi:hypothetical protein